RQAARQTIPPPPPPPSRVVEEPVSDAAATSDPANARGVDTEPGLDTGPDFADRGLESMRPPDPPRRPPPLPSGVLDLGAAPTVAFGPLARDSGAETLLALDGLRHRGGGQVLVSTDLDLKRVSLEVRLGGEWRTLTAEATAVDLAPGERPAWPLRLRTGECPEGASASAGYSLKVEADGADGRRLSLSVPLGVEVVADPWLRCWWPILALACGALLIGIGVHGYASPSRFAPRANLVLSPEEDMAEGFPHPLRGQRGSRSGFYRDARLFLREDLRLDRRSGGAWVRLRADGRRLRLKAIGGAVYRQTVDGEWEPLGDGESTVRPGSIYRNEIASIYFEYRQS
ncbi:MAG: hypothetical protein AAFY88_10265, partial [Acidobacteriota bacterium]